MRNPGSYHGMLMLGLIERIKVTWRLTIITPAIIEVIPLLLWIPVISSQMPLANMTRNVAGWLQ